MAIDIPYIGGFSGCEAGADDDTNKWDDDASERDGSKHLDELDADGNYQRQDQHDDRAVQPEVVPRVMMHVAEDSQLRRDVQLQRVKTTSSSAAVIASCDVT